MSYDIVGREKEIQELEYLMGTGKSEFLAVYGRRRVGKSFLINEVYGSAMAFRTVGIYIKNEDMTEESYRQEQLKHSRCSSSCSGASVPSVRWFFWMNYLGWLVPNRLNSLRNSAFSGTILPLSRGISCLWCAEVLRAGCLTM